MSKQRIRTGGQAKGWGSKQMTAWLRLYAPSATEILTKVPSGPSGKDSKPGGWLTERQLKLL